ncbi:NAD(+) synthase [Candidatus Woesearchaeota archaeon]|nr:NAD(+) synthase [Candidatus Woesearchaeota archaeon]
MRKTYFQLLEEIKNFFRRSHSTKATLGVSGGLDSAVALKLCCDALQSKNVSALIMPENGLTSERNINDALDFCKKMRVRHFVVDITLLLNAFNRMSWKQSKIALMNTKARIRGCLLYNYADSNESLVVGTANKSELLLGYGIKYGDLAADVFILGDLLRSDVVELAKFMEIPEEIIKKKPTPELTVGQTAEDDLGAPYKRLDSLLKRYLSNDKLNRKDNLIKKTLQKIEKNKHKLETVPIIELK